MKNLIFLFLLILSCAGFSQSSFIPANLGSDVNTEYPELNPVISPDGHFLYFVRANHPENHFGARDSQDIWYSTKIDDTTWSTPLRLSTPFNTARYNAVIAISADGNKIYINGVYDKKLRWKKRGLSFVSKIGDHDYGNLQRIKIKKYSKMSKGKYAQIFLNDAENIMLLSFSKKWNSKKNDLYVSLKNSKNGKWKKPKQIKKPIKSKWSELAPSLSKDGSKLFFTSKMKNKNGNFDIYYSEKEDDTYRNWSAPTKVSDTINSNKWDGYYSLNGKGSWAYFASTDNSIGSSDIFRVKIFEENPFVLVNGKILNKVTNDPILGKELKLSVNGSTVDSINIDPETGAFRIKLPLGEEYILSTEAENYVSISDTVNVKSFREYTESKKILYLTPVPYVLLSGSVKVKGSGDTITKANEPEILINGKSVDSLQLDDKGNYTIKLEYGKAYVFQAKAKGFQPGEAKLDLRDVNEYKELTQDLYVSKVIIPKAKEALITGKIVNSKTMKGIDSTVVVDIHVNDFPSINVEVKDSIYKITVPLGQTYVINANAKNYYPVYETIDLKNEKETVKIFKDLYIAPLEIGASVKLNNIFFETGKSTLKSASFPELDRVVKFMKEYETIKIEIAGHTDNIGNAALNKKLSQARADAVGAYLIKSGVTPDRIVTKGYGMEKPVSTNKTKVGRAQNRRVEFTIIEK